MEEKKSLVGVPHTHTHYVVTLVLCNIVPGSEIHPSTNMLSYIVRLYSFISLTGI
jgi:hypothetical protein